MCKKYFIDTEFIESGPNYPITLLSLGIVCEDGAAVYYVNKDADLSRANEWVKQNVLPYLELDNNLDFTASLQEIASYVKDFCGDTPEFWGYYSDYDWVVFCQIFGTMMDLPDKWPMYCNDIKQFCTSLGSPKLPDQNEREHNALNDARWNKLAYDFLEQLMVQASA